MVIEDIKKDLKKIIKKIKSNKSLPKPIDVEEEGEYVPIEIQPSQEIEEVREEEKEEEKVVEVVKEIKIYPKLFVARIRHPIDFKVVKEKAPDVDVIILNVEELPEEILNKEFVDLKNYLTTLKYNLGLIGENILLAFKEEVELERYVSQIKEDAEEV
ncbi:hypothetical protein [Methanocaldococcus infernus]